MSALTRREIALLSTLIHRHMATIKRRSSEDEAEWEFRLNGFEELAQKLRGMYDNLPTEENIARGAMTATEVVAGQRELADRLGASLSERPKAGNQAEEPSE